MPIADITVVIPAYNASEKLPACLQTLLDQSIKAKEILVFDDCSTDNTLEIAQQWAETLEGLQVISLEKNIGQGEIRNRGMDTATGKYILFLDSDDMLEPAALETVYSLAEQHQTDTVIFNHIVHSWRGHTKSNLHAFTFERSGDRVLTDADKWPLIFNDLVPWNKFCRLDFLKQNAIRFDDGRIYEDLSWSIQALYYSKSLYAVSKPLYHYVVAQNSSIRSSSVNHLPLFENYARLIEKIGDDQDFRPMLFARMLQQFAWFTRNYREKMSAEDYKRFYNTARKFIKQYYSPEVKNALLNYGSKPSPTRIINHIEAIHFWPHALTFNAYLKVRNKVNKLFK